jgi:hypothetical protein
VATVGQIIADRHRAVCKQIGAFCIALAIALSWAEITFVGFPSQKITMFINRRFSIQQFELARFGKSQPDQNLLNKSANVEDPKRTSGLLDDSQD